MFPDVALALDARGVLQWTRAGVGRQALPSVAHPGLAIVADGTLRDVDQSINQSITA